MEKISVFTILQKIYNTEILQKYGANLCNMEIRENKVL